MIDTVRFENDAGKIFRLTDYGLLLKSFSAPEPAAKTYRETLDGADGDLDMTEWAGVIRYETRAVTIEVRDMTDQWWRELVNFLHGRNVKITHSQDEEHYYYGRAQAEHETGDRVTDVRISAICQPYRMRHEETVITRQVSGSDIVYLEAGRQPVTPTVTVDAEINLEYEGTGITLTPGTHTIRDLIITDNPVQVTINGTGTITFAWRDGVL